MTDQANVEQEQHRLPPKPVRAVMNTIMKTILRSPFHGGLSEMIMIIGFTGRKTGRRYATPVTYMQQGDTITCFTRSAWWKNLRGGAPVTLRVQGAVLRGTAHPVTEPEAVAAGARRFIEQKGLEALPRIGVMLDTSRPPTDDELIAAVTGRVMIEIKTRRT
jgi:hypothetical protein